ETHSKRALVQTRELTGQRVLNALQPRRGGRPVYLKVMESIRTGRDMLNSSPPCCSIVSWSQRVSWRVAANVRYAWQSLSLSLNEEGMPCTKMSGRTLLDRRVSGRLIRLELRRGMRMLWAAYSMPRRSRGYWASQRRCRADRRNGAGWQRLVGSAGSH